MQTYGSSYYLATLFFPEHIKKDIFTLYKFVRIPDQLVDDVHTDNLATHYTNAQSHLKDLYIQRQTAYQKQNIHHDKFGPMVELMYRKHIPVAYVDAFWQAMLQDTQVHLYQTYEQLAAYMYGSADIVGLIVCHIVWFTSDALPFAQELWSAMQLANFLRDIKEDYLELWRIYIPEQDLLLFGCNHKDIIDFCRREKISDAFTHFMQSYVHKVKGMFAHSMWWLDYLDPIARKPVRLAAKLYNGILDKIIEHDYNVFDASMRTNKWEKIGIVSQCLWQSYTDAKLYHTHSTW